MRIAILLPCYNVEAFLNETLDSIEAQTHENYVVYAYDDKSSDQTARIIRLRSRANKKIKYVNAFADQPANLGWCGAYNHVAHQALIDSTQHQMIDAFFIMGADDALRTDALERMVMAMHENLSDFVVATGEVMGSNPPVYMGSTPNATLEMFKQYNAIANFALIRARMWQDLKGYDTQFRYADWEFWIRAIKAKKSYTVIKQPVYLYRLHENNDHKKADYAAEYQKILLKHFS